ncbi:MAG: type 4a pilus biogenesis protein PilO [Deltaproteobacteria bacterium]|nr:type 4a pilus biogenesis protein PilO [Deltaproteobacteria bacterium]
MRKFDISEKIVTPIINTVSGFSKVQKILIVVGIFVLAGGGFAYFSYYPKYKEITRLAQEQMKLDKDLAHSKKKAAEYESYKKKMVLAERNFRQALQALPEKKEIPSLLTNISRSGQDVGLEFLLFQPQAEVQKEFYAEIPVSIQVDGSYHNVAMFFDKVAGLSRIVNIHDIKMTAQKNPGALRTACTAVTYRFVEAPPPKKKGGKKKKK